MVIHIWLVGFYEHRAAAEFKMCHFYYTKSYWRKESITRLDHFLREQKRASRELPPALELKANMLCMVLRDSKMIPGARPKLARFVIE